MTELVTINNIYGDTSAIKREPFHQTKQHSDNDVAGDVIEVDIQPDAPSLQLQNSMSFVAAPATSPASTSSLSHTYQSLRLGFHEYYRSSTILHAMTAIMSLIPLVDIISDYAFIAYNVDESVRTWDFRLAVVAFFLLWNSSRVVSTWFLAAAALENVDLSQELVDRISFVLGDEFSVCNASWTLLPCIETRLMCAPVELVTCEIVEKQSYKRCCCMEIGCRCCSRSDFICQQKLYEILVFSIFGPCIVIGYTLFHVLTLPGQKLYWWLVDNEYWPQWLQDRQTYSERAVVYLAYFCNIFCVKFSAQGN